MKRERERERERERKRNIHLIVRKFFVIQYLNSFLLLSAYNYFFNYLSFFKFNLSFL